MGSQRVGHNLAAAQQQEYTVMSKYDWKVLVIYLLSLSSYALLYDAGA